MLCSLIAIRNFHYTYEFFLIFTTAIFSLTVPFYVMCYTIETTVYGFKTRNILYMKFCLLDLFYFRFIVIIYHRNDFEFKHRIFVPLWITLHKQQSFTEIIVYMLHSRRLDGSHFEISHFSPKHPGSEYGDVS